jgi:hypothetical protein
VDERSKSEKNGAGRLSENRERGKNEKLKIKNEKLKTEVVHFVQ